MYLEGKITELSFSFWLWSFWHFSWFFFHFLYLYIIASFSPHAVLHQSCPEEQTDLCETPWTVLHIQLDAALLNKRRGPREPWTPWQGWWCSPNSASAESSVSMMFPPLPTGTSLRSWELILSALSVAVGLTAKARLRGVQLICQRSDIFNPIFNWFRLEPLKDTAVPKTSEEIVAKPAWPNRRSYGSLQAPATDG